MARIRTIKPEFQNSQSMGRISREARLAFIELWPQCDDAGRIRANSRMLASVLFPYDADAPELIDGWLKELEDEGCIVRYRIERDEYLQIIHWSHQKIDHPRASELPAPPEKISKKTKLSSREKDTKLRETPTKPRAVSSTVPDRTVPGEEGSGAAPPGALPAVISLPTNRFDSTGEEVGFSQDDIDDYSSTYPAVDVLQQLREMRRWSLDNPDNRKTAGGIRKFVNRWLAKEQDSSRPQNSRQPMAQILKVV